jgi:iron complex outermembrane receptor protein
MLLRSTFRRLLLAGGALAALHPAGVRAQAVNYGALEELFGQAVTTSVTGKPQLASQVPGDLVIITQDDIRRSGADNIPDILQFVTGIDVRKFSFGDTQIAIRGYNTPIDPRLLVMVDGRQVYLDDYGYVAWNMIPVQLDEIRQIEVIKGPASALFGFNAAAGVINIITYDPLLDKVNTATVRGGTQGYGAGDGVATVHFGSTLGVRVSLGGWTATGYPTQSGAPDPERPRYDSFNFSGRWQAASNILVRFEAGTTDGQTAREITAGSSVDTQNRVDFLRLGAASDTPIGLIDADVYENHAVNDYGADGPFINDTNRVLVAKLSDLLKLNPTNTIRLGLEFRRNSLTFENGSNALAYNNYAANGMWDWQITPTIDLNNAVRIDHLELSDSGPVEVTPGRTRAIYNATTITAPSFNSGLVIKVSDKDTVRLTVARGLQVPSLFSFGIQIVIPPVEAIVGSPSVVPVAVWNAELAYDRNLDWLGGKLTTAVFFQRNTDLLAAGEDGPAVIQNGTAVLTEANIGSSNEIGLEAGLNGKTEGGFRWNASYRYETIKDDIAASFSANDDPSTHFQDGTPVHAIILGAGYSIGRWEMDAQGRWQSSYDDWAKGAAGIYPVVVGNYVTLNARIGFRVTKYLTVSGTAQQFNNSRLLETDGDYVDRRFFASANVKF